MEKRGRKKRKWERERECCFILKMGIENLFYANNGA